MEAKTGRAYIGAFLIGAVISLMVTFNTEFGRLTSSEVSTTVNQIVGIVLLFALMAAARGNEKINPPRRHAGWYMYFGGLFGIAIISINYVAVVNTGATVAMAGAVFGQSLMGFIFDVTGLFGMERRNISARRTVSLLVSCSGILMMLAGGTIDAIYLLLSMSAGALTMMQMVYNSTLAKAKGAFYSARCNVISGLAGALLYSFIFHPATTIAGLEALDEVPFLLMIAGGTLACIVVVGTNVIIPRIPAVHSALLLSSGQILAAVLIDYLLYGIFTAPLLAGAIVMLVGMAIGGKGK